MTINPTSSFRLPISPVQGGQAIRPSSAPTEAAASEQTSAARVPAGVNPQLWGVLTEAEQAFFVRQNSLGPLTYGPKQAAHMDAAGPRGQRIDVRV
jgi:hypothetical protein